MRERLFVAIVLVTFWMSFSLNALHIVSPEWFYRQNRDMESYVLGKLIVSRQYGFFYKAGLTGQAAATNLEPYPPALVEDTYARYLNNDGLTGFTPYLSHPGGQAVFLATLDRWLPFSPLLKLHFYHALISLLSAIAITMVIGWIYRIAGVWAAAAAFIGTLFSSWLTVFGRNLWWCLAAFYVPFLVLVYMLVKQKSGTRELIFATCIGVLVKYAATGYEYVTTALLMMFVPIVYYGIANGWGISKAVKIVGSVITGTVLATLLSIAVLSWQIRIVTGSFRNALDHFVISLLKRTFADPSGFSPAIAWSLKTPVLTVLRSYLAGYYFGPVKYWHLFAFFILAILVLLAGRRDRQDWAYMMAVCFSVLAPLSWLVIFKAHSQLHPHMNFIVWQMPFTLLGFGLMGRAAVCVIDSRRFSESRSRFNGL